MNNLINYIILQKQAGEDYGSIKLKLASKGLDEAQALELIKQADRQILDAMKANHTPQKSMMGTIGQNTSRRLSVLLMVVGAGFVIASFLGYLPSDFMLMLFEGPILGLLWFLSRSGNRKLAERRSFFENTPYTRNEQERTELF